MHICSRVGAIGYSWLDGLLRNPWSGVQTPQVLMYSGMRVAEPLVGGSNPYGAGGTLRDGGLGPHMSNQGTPCRRFPGMTGLKTISPSRDRTPRIGQHSSNRLVTNSFTHPANYRQKAAHGGETAQITGRADKACAVVLVNAIYKWPD